MECNGVYLGCTSALRLFSPKVKISISIKSLQERGDGYCCCVTVFLGERTEIHGIESCPLVK